MQRGFHPGVPWLALLLLCGCVGADDPEPHAGASDTDRLRVLSFNIEWGGAHVSFDNVISAIRRADADVVGIQEAEGNLERLARELGWNFDERSYVVSPLPLIDPPGGDGRYVYVEVAPGRIVAIANLHLPSDPYGPYAVQDGASVDEVVALERAVRLPMLQPVLAALPPLVQRGMPVFVTGDFNSPSGSDWTAATVGLRPALRYALEWPVSAAMTNAGFRDSYRTRRPNPVADPGLTWWAARPPIPGYVIADDEPQDRIDYIWFAGPVQVVDSTLVGEAGADGVTIDVMPWPSDHRAVLSTFDVVPAAMPEVVTTGRRVYRHGDPIDVRHYLLQGSSAALTIVEPQQGSRELLAREVAGTGSLALPPGRIGGGHYELRTTLAGGDTLPAREFWVLGRDAAPAIAAGSARYASGAPIALSWRDAPGFRNDYIAIYSAGVTPSEDGDPLWLYVDARPSGTLQLDARTAGARWPLPPGDYAAWLMKDDGYEPLAAPAAFTVTP